MEEQLHDLLQPWKNSTRKITSVAYHAHITIYMEESRELYVMEQKTYERGESLSFLTFGHYSLRLSTTFIN
jgi:hypothetical protein